MYSVVVKFPGDRPLLRIGELSLRPGMSDHVFGAWQNRYCLLQPVRSPGGLRLYTAAGARLMAGDPVTGAGRAGWSR
jgi:MerR family transcriptional regulator, light-induced transcriptional regulator